MSSFAYIGEMVEARSSQHALTTVRELGAALQARRVELGLTQAQLCQRAGVARSWLSRLEAGRHPGAETQKVLDVLAMLGLSVVLVPAQTEVSAENTGDDPFADYFGSEP